VSNGYFYKKKKRRSRSSLGNFYKITAMVIFIKEKKKRETSFKKEKILNKF